MPRITWISFFFFFNDSSQSSHLDTVQGRVKPQNEFILLPIDGKDAQCMEPGQKRTKINVTRPRPAPVHCSVLRHTKTSTKSERPTFKFMVQILQQNSNDLND